MRRIAGFVVIIVLLITCKKDEPMPPEVPQYNINQQVKDFTYFQPATYWVYEDSISLALDSVFVTEASISVSTVHNPLYPWSEPEYYKSENMDVYFESSATGQRNKLNSSASEDQRSSLKFYAIEPTSDEVFSTQSPFEQNVDSAVGTGLITDYWANVNLGGTNYTDCFRVAAYGDMLAGNANSNYFLVKNIGIVRKEYSALNQVWKLIRYNIVQ